MLPFVQSAASSHANGTPVVTQPGNMGKHPVGNGGKASGRAQHTFVSPLVMVQVEVPHDTDIGVATPMGPASPAVPPLPPVAYVSASLSVPSSRWWNATIELPFGSLL